jgi:hypothetical protein
MGVFLPSTTFLKEKKWCWVYFCDIIQRLKMPEKLERLEILLPF